MLEYATIANMGGRGRGGGERMELVFKTWKENTKAAMFHLAFLVKFSLLHGRLGQHIFADKLAANNKS